MWNNKNTDIAYEAIIKRAKLFDITPRIVKEAGLLHAEKRTVHSKFSLADSMIINSAKAIGAKLITKDLQFKELKEAIIL